MSFHRLILSAMPLLLVFACKFDLGKGSGAEGNQDGTDATELKIVEMPGTGSATLRVVNATSSAPISGADVLLNGVPFGKTSNDGLVSMTTAVGRATVTVTMENFLAWEQDLPITADLQEHIARLNPLGQSRKMVVTSGKLTTQEGDAKLIISSDSSLYGPDVAARLTWISDQDPGLLPGPFCFIDFTSQMRLLTGALNIQLPSIPRFDMVLVFPLPPGVDSAGFQLRTWRAISGWSANPMSPSKIENGLAYFRYPPALLSAVASANQSKISASGSMDQPVTVTVGTSVPNVDTNSIIVGTVVGTGTVLRDGKSKSLLKGMKLTAEDIVTTNRESSADLFFLMAPKCT